MTEVAPRKRVTHRATLAPDKAPGGWTVGDFRKFIQDCDDQEIPDEAQVFQELRGWDVPGHFIAERHTSLD